MSYSSEEIARAYLDAFERHHGWKHQLTKAWHKCVPRIRANIEKSKLTPNQYFDVLLGWYAQKKIPANPGHFASEKALQMAKDLAEKRTKQHGGKLALKESSFDVTIQKCWESHQLLKSHLDRLNLHTALALVAPRLDPIYLALLPIDYQPYLLLPRLRSEIQGYRDNPESIDSRVRVAAEQMIGQLYDTTNQPR